MIDQYAKKEKISKNVKIREEEPVRKSSRMRSSTFKGQEYSQFMGINGDSIYCEDDKDLEKLLFCDETEYLMSVMNESHKTQGVRRKKKQGQELSN